MTLLTSLHLTEIKCICLECDSRTVSIMIRALFRKLKARFPRPNIRGPIPLLGLCTFPVLAKRMQLRSADFRNSGLFHCFLGGEYPI